MVEDTSHGGLRIDRSGAEVSMIVPSQAYRTVIS